MCVKEGNKERERERAERASERESVCVLLRELRGIQRETHTYREREAEREREAKREGGEESTRTWITSRGRHLLVPGWLSTIRS